MSRMNVNFTPRGIVETRIGQGNPTSVDVSFNGTDVGLAKNYPYFVGPGGYETIQAAIDAAAAGIAAGVPPVVGIAPAVYVEDLLITTNMQLNWIMNYWAVGGDDDLGLLSGNIAVVNAGSYFFVMLNDIPQKTLAGGPALLLDGNIQCYMDGCVILAYTTQEIIVTTGAFVNLRTNRCWFSGGSLATFKDSCSTACRWADNGSDLVSLKGDVAGLELGALCQLNFYGTKLTASPSTTKPMFLLSGTQTHNFFGCDFKMDDGAARQFMLFGADATVNLRQCSLRNAGGAAPTAAFDDAGGGIGTVNFGGCSFENGTGTKAAGVTVNAITGSIV